MLSHYGEKRVNIELTSPLLRKRFLPFKSEIGNQQSEIELSSRFPIPFCPSLFPVPDSRFPAFSR